MDNIWKNVVLICVDILKVLRPLILIAKLPAYGIEYKTVKLFKSYLSKRWQRIKINILFSSWCELITGVLVLGSLLFNIFINDLFYFFSVVVNMFDYPRSDQGSNPS